ncbi:MAG TPA: hypothetical protein PLX04_00970 [Caldisericia bacterium]|nr:hypothetical protein [Caldisericia bacterium]HOR46351.1 hypothetical protein [Caldisericia bacterium]HOU08330.1 hypothetical protein [Caldisericia bacterium]HPL88821.1 hypothetical protein [Caldisericia bacterium]HQG59929.1 hypothetical protein [Caldisericia bacterium]
MKLRTTIIGKNPINGVYIEDIYDLNSHSYYSIIADGDVLKICDKKTRSLIFSELKLPGAAISSYYAEHKYYMICKSQKGNSLVCFSYDDTLRKLELHKKFEVKTQSSQIVSELPGMDGVITQSEDKTILYLYTKGKLIKSIKYSKPTIWWHPNYYDHLQNIGFDGQDLIFQTDSDHDGIFYEIREKIKEPSSIDNAFFQPTGWYERYVDLYDGINLWRIETCLNGLGNMHIKGPLEIKNLKKGFNQILYPYEKGLCRVEISKTDSSKLVLKHIDDRSMYPVVEFSRNWTIPAGYYLYGCKENDSYELKCYKFFWEDIENSDRNLAYKECDVEAVDSREGIISGDYYNPNNDYSSSRDVSFIIFTKDGIYYIPDATNW